MNTYTFELRLDKIVPHTATITVEADNVADAIQKVRYSQADGATWEPEGPGYWDDKLVVDGMNRVLPPLDFEVEAEPIGELGLAWFKRMEARGVAA